MNKPRADQKVTNAENQQQKPDSNKTQLKPKPGSEPVPQLTARRESEESYNPFKHRHVVKKTSDVGALAHLLKTSLGSGILAMPMAIKNAGLVLGVIGTMTIGIICTHCLQLLIKNSQILCKRARIPELGYAETLETAFETGSEKVKRWAKPMKVIVTLQLLLSFILGNTVYVVFMAESMEQVLVFYFLLEINIRYYMLMLWIPLILMCLLRSLKSLVPFSILANIFVLISFSITLYYIFRQINKPGTVDLVAPWYRWPFFLTTVVFSLEGIGTVMSIENEMENPTHLLGRNKKCCGILYIAMSIVVALYTVIGFFGYLQYGDKTEGSITLNLPIKDVLAQTVKILIALAIFFTYALQFYVPINITYNLIINAVKKKGKVQEKNYIYIEVAVRISLVSVTIFIGMAVPKLEPVITLVGAICFSMLGLTFPPLLDIVVSGKQTGAFKWKLVKNILIITFSFIVVVSGTYAGVNSVIEVYVKGK